MRGMKSVRAWALFLALLGAIWLKRRFTPRWVEAHRRPASEDFPQYRRAWKD